MLNTHARAMPMLWHVSMEEGNVVYYTCSVVMQEIYGTMYLCHFMVYKGYGYMQSAPQILLLYYLDTSIHCHID